MHRLRVWNDHQRLRSFAGCSRWTPLAPTVVRRRVTWLADGSLVGGRQATGQAPPQSANVDRSSSTAEERPVASNPSAERTVAVTARWRRCCLAERRMKKAAPQQRWRRMWMPWVKVDPATLKFVWFAHDCFDMHSLILLHEIRSK